MNPRDNTAAINQAHWQKMVQEGCGFTIPWLDLDRNLIRRYAAGELDTVPAPLNEIHPAGVLANVEGEDVLCLASGGGQQSAVFGLLGARVTVVDLTGGQLDGDRRAAAHYGYQVTTIQADMRDLSCLARESFDLVYQAESMAYVPDAREVYSQVGAVLRPAGLYRTSFTNPIAEFADWDGEAYRIAVPYVHKSSQDAGGPIEFRHYLSEVFNGLLALGFSIQEVREDPRYLRGDAQPSPGSWDHFLLYMPGFAVVAKRG